MVQDTLTKKRAGGQVVYFNIISYSGYDNSRLDPYSELASHSKKEAVFLTYTRRVI